MLDIRDSNYPHIKFVDLNNNGILEEVAVMKLFPNGDMAYITVASLDDTDKSRLLKVVTSEHAHMFTLDQLLKNTTLKNGMNALVYFQQLVKVRTASGRTIEANSNRRGSGRIDTNEMVQETAPTSKKGRKLVNEVPE